MAQLIRQVNKALQKSRLEDIRACMILCVLLKDRTDLILEIFLLIKTCDVIICPRGNIYRVNRIGPKIDPGIP